MTRYTVTEFALDLIILAVVVYAGYTVISGFIYPQQQVTPDDQTF